MQKKRKSTFFSGRDVSETQQKVRAMAAESSHRSVSSRRGYSMRRLWPYVPFVAGKASKIEKMYKTATMDGNC